VPPDRQLLRDQVMEVFLQKRPTTRTEWFNCVALNVRQSTDLLQIRKYLPRVLDLLSQLVD
ncbi:MAG: hypothetical protein ACREP9_14885, partial [Candidatus Dormibacteraceae bacterium]